MLGGIKAKGLDVSQQGDPLVEPHLSRANGGDAWHQGIGEQCRRFGQFLLAGVRLGLPHGDVDQFHDIVDANVVFAFLVQKNHLIGRKTSYTLLGKPDARQDAGVPR